MSVSKAQQKATNRYVAKVYDRINILVPKGKRGAIQVHAKGRGESTNAFINRAVAETMDRDNGSAPQMPRIQSNESEGGYYNAELFDAILDAVKQYGGDLSGFIDDAITAYLKSYPSIMKLKRMEAELYTAQEAARERAGIEEPEESKEQEDSFSNLSTDEIIEKFLQVGELRRLNLKTAES